MREGYALGGWAHLPHERPFTGTARPEGREAAASKLLKARWAPTKQEARRPFEAILVDGRRRDMKMGRSPASEGRRLMKGTTEPANNEWVDWAQNGAQLPAREVEEPT